MATDIYSAYRNICRDLRGLMVYEGIARKTMEQAHTVMMKGRAPSSEICFVPLDKSVIAFNLAVEDYNETTAKVDEFTSAKVQIEQIIATMSDVEKIIITLHVEQGMDLMKIADISNYEYGYIRNKASILRNKYKDAITA